MKVCWTTANGTASGFESPAHHYMHVSEHDDATKLNQEVVNQNQVDILHMRKKIC